MFIYLLGDWRGVGVIRLFLTRHTPQDNAVLVVSQRVASNPLQASPAAQRPARVTVSALCS